MILGAFLIILRKPGRSTSAVPEKSIAVLPSENLSSDKENAYFAEGIQDEILTKLASIADLKVISRTSTAKYQSRPEDLKTVSQQVGVANVVEAPCREPPTKCASTCSSSTRMRTRTSGPSLTTAISRMSLPSRAKFHRRSPMRCNRNSRPPRPAPWRRRPTKDPEAYDSFLKGEYEEREAESSLKAEPFDRAAAFYQQALSRDPNFALAAARLAESRMFRHWFVTRLSDAELAQVKSIVDRALALAPNLAEAHLAMGDRKSVV